MHMDEIDEAIASAARGLGVAPAALAAIAQIEAAMRVFAHVGGRREPLIRFEGHYFDRRLSGAARQQARAAGLASPSAGAVANPAAQEARWRLLDRAAAIDRKAALESTSWGIGQVMGAHWAWLGYRDIEALVAEARSGATGQFRLMARYIDKAGLSDALRDHDWAAFARGYNGPAFARNNYDGRLAAAFARQSARLGENAARSLRRGMRGEDVRALQSALAARGHALILDGAFGPQTHAALVAFQRAEGLAANGIADTHTFSRLSSAKAARPTLFGLLRGLFRRLTERPV